MALFGFICWFFLLRGFAPGARSAREASKTAERKASDELAYQAETLQTKAERAFDESRLGSIDDGENLVLYKREIEDIRIQLDKAVLRQDGPVIVARSEKLLELITNIQTMDQARRDARQVKETAMASLQKAEPFKDTQPERIKAAMEGL